MQISKPCLTKLRKFTFHSYFNWTSFRFKAKRITVRIGSSYSNREAALSSGGIEYITTSYSIHLEYNNNTGEFDVGVVKIDGGMQLNGRNTDIIGLPLYSNDANFDEILVITGWGSTKVSCIENRISIILICLLPLY